MSEEPTRDTVKVEALKERMGQIVVNYEEALANLRTDATIQIAALNATIDELREENNALKDRETPVSAVNSDS